MLDLPDQLDANIGDGEGRDAVCSRGLKMDRNGAGTRTKLCEKAATAIKMDRNGVGTRTGLWG